MVIPCVSRAAATAHWEHPPLRHELVIDEPLTQARLRWCRAIAPGLHLLSVHVHTPDFVMDLLVAVVNGAQDLGGIQLELEEHGREFPHVWETLALRPRVRELTLGGWVILTLQGVARIQPLGYLRSLEVPPPLHSGTSAL